MKVVVNGCSGRMGVELIEVILDSPGCSVVCGVRSKSGDSDRYSFPVVTSLEEYGGDAEVVIDFSAPASLSGLMNVAVERNIPVVIATTGIPDEVQATIDRASRQIPVFQSANMSIGISVLRELIRRAMEALGEDFDIEILERHHRMKKDSPSGTALLLANELNRERRTPYSLSHGRSGRETTRTNEEIGIHSIRGGSIVGEHQVVFAGPDEVLELSHYAYSRRIFATGALRAARFLVGASPGIYTMEDLLVR